MGVPWKGEQGGEGRGGDVLALCMLQRADGDFALDEKLAACIGASLKDLRALAHVPGAPGDEGLLATLVALAACRSLFASQKPEWELQEGKALRLLAEHGISASEAHNLIAAFCLCVPALRKGNQQGLPASQAS
ncbi:hypothetical protein T484DRAFT_1808412 [Baffinella frigidus]|nr:hypothetical protein T484DRAFT_1808412 [Cryptophyta sp. CCMP2293]